MVILWTTFFPIKNVSHQNFHFELSLHTFSFQTIVQLNQPSNIFTLFWLFSNVSTTVEPLQVIISSTLYDYSSIFLWSFSYHGRVVSFWLICLHWPGHRSLVLKFFLGCVKKLSVRRIQTRHTNLLHLLVCGRLWRGC